MMDITIVKMLSDNYAYLVRDEASGQTAIVDPAEPEPVIEALQDEPLHWIVITHRHGDHVAGVPSLVQQYGAQVVAPLAEQDALAAMGITIDKAVQHDDLWQLGDSQAQVIATPGHTMGHVAYYFADASALFCGDSLFSLGCGRLFEGDGDDLWLTMTRLRSLPDETLVYCGHEYTLANGVFALQVDGDNTALQNRIAQAQQLRRDDEPTIPARLGDEKQCNPYLRADDDDFKRILHMADSSPAEVVAYVRQHKDQF